MEICNLTSHSIAIVDANGTLIKEYPSRGVATCDTQEKLQFTEDGVDVYAKRYKPVLGLPAQSVDLDKFYIVSPEVGEACRDTRFDILVPAGITSILIGDAYAHTYLLQV